MQVSGLSNFEILACKNQEMSEKDIWLRSGTSTHRDGNENAIGLLSKTTSLHVRHAFLYISLPLLHNYDVKMPSFTFYGGRKQATTNFSFSF